MRALYFLERIYSFNLQFQLGAISIKIVSSKYVENIKTCFIILRGRKCWFMTAVSIKFIHTSRQLEETQNGFQSSDFIVIFESDKVQ